MSTWALRDDQVGFCVSFAHAVIAYVSLHGGDTTPVLEALELSAQMPQTRGGPRVTAMQFSAALNAASRHLNDEHIGLHIGMSMLPVRLGAMGYAVMTAPSGICAMKLYEELQRLLTTELIVRHAITGTLAYAYLESSIDLPSDYAFWSFWLAYRLAYIRSACAGHVVPERVTLPCAPPRCEQALRAFVGTPTQFNANGYGEWLPVARLHASNPQSSLEIHQIMATMARREWREQFEPDEALIACLKSAILLALNKGDNPTLQTLAPKLAQAQAEGAVIGTRQLQRKLAALQRGFRGLVEEVRRERTLVQLRSTDRPLADIAAEAGYAELSSFHRAVRRWTGLTPKRIRNEGFALDVDLV
jgi:AraC-like DNA-binding protein